MDVFDAGDTRINDVHAPSIAQASQAVPRGAQESGTSTNSQVAKLEPFLLLAKSTRGAAAAALVQKATSSPGVFVFSELLACPSIDELKSGQHRPVYDLLQLFAYGTWEEYRNRRDSLPALDQSQQTKLKLLTILTLASIDRTIPYPVLLERLDLPSIPALEDLLIEGFYSGVFSGRLDQRESVLEISSGIGRDVRLVEPAQSSAEQPVAPTIPSQSVQSLLNAVAAFQRRVSVIVRSLDGHLSQLVARSVHDAKVEREHEARLQALIQEVNAQHQQQQLQQQASFASERKESRRARAAGQQQEASSVAGAAATAAGEGGENGEGMDVDSSAAERRGGGSSQAAGGPPAASGSPSGTRARKRGRT